MEPPKFVLPSPKFDDETKNSLEKFGKLHKPHFSTPMGMQLPKSLQPPPMYGPRGPTIPPKFLNSKAPRHHAPNTSRKPAQQAKPAVQHWESYCEICDYELKSVEELDRHKSEHRKCQVEGCTYIGHFR
jgi:hypothetical protein